MKNVSPITSLCNVRTKPLMQKGTHSDIDAGRMGPTGKNGFYGFLPIE